MLSLTDDQMNQLQAAASMLPPGEPRQTFIRSVAGRLTEPPLLVQPSDYQVSRAIQFVLTCRGVAAGSALFPTQEKQHDQISRRRNRR
jgi:hypothetical protein